MKTLRHFLLSLVVISTGIAQLDAMKRQLEDPEYAQAYKLNFLKEHLDEVNENAEPRLSDFGMWYKPQLKGIKLTEDVNAQMIAPTIYQLLSSKIHTIGKCLGVNVLTINIFLILDERPEVNALAIPIKRQLTIHSGLLKLMA